MKPDNRERTLAPSPDQKDLYLLPQDDIRDLTNKLLKKVNSSLRYRFRRWYYKVDSFTRSDAEYLVKYYWPVIRAEYEHNEFFRKIDLNHRHTDIAGETADRIVLGLEDALLEVNHLKSSNRYGFNIWLILGSVVLRIVLQWLFEKLIELWNSENKRSYKESKWIT